MHDEISTSIPGKAYSHDPLGRVPRPGKWVLWHGEHAQAALALAQKQGRRLDGLPRDCPPLPEGFPRPSSRCDGRFLLESSGLRLYLQHDEHDGYVCCYVCNLAEAEP